MNIDKRYLVSKETKKETIVKIGSLSIGKDKVIIAGPCTITDKESLIEVAKALKKMGVNILRGGAFKPRKDPYTFQGLEETGLDYLIEAKKITGLPIITEITSLTYLDKYIKNIDIIQVGSKNMFNYELLKELGKTKKPILLKRNMSSTYEEWLMAAEYILKEGNPNVILCERGIRTFENETRNTLDLQAIPVIKKYSHLPIIIDPSHAAGDSYIVKPMILASLIAGSDGIMVEVDNLKTAICDQKQTLTLDELECIIEDIKRINL